MPDLDFAKPVTLTFHDGSIYTLVRGTWCDTNGIPCDEDTSEYMQNMLDFIELEAEFFRLLIFIFSFYSVATYVAMG